MNELSKKNGRTRTLLVGVLLLVAVAVAALLVPRLRKTATPQQSARRIPIVGQIPPVRQIAQSKQTTHIAAPTAPMGADHQNDLRLSLPPANVHPIASQIRLQRVLKYGREEGELGMIRAHEQSPVGPESFACGINGKVFLADLVNQRILVYSADGVYLRKIDLPGIVLNDIALDERGDIYVYDQVQRTLHQLDSQGTTVSDLKLDPADIGTRGYFHVVGNSVYFADAAARDILVATIQDGVLMAEDSTVDRISEGIHAKSDLVYSLSLVRGQAMQVHVRSEDQSVTPLHLDVPVSGIVSATYLGEDQTRRFYVQTERMVDNTIVLEVHAFGSTGEKLAVTRIPENDYALWTTRLLTVGADGALVQFLPKVNQAKLIFFARY